MSTIAERPTLHDLVSAAGAGVEKRASVTAEALRQAAATAGEKTADIEPAVADDGVIHVSTEEVLKIAAAVDFLAGEFQKEADEHSTGPGNGPGALDVLEVKATEKNIDAGEMGTATSKHLAPKSPATQPEQVQSGKANTGLETNDGMQHAEQPVDPMGNKTTTNAPQKGTEGASHATPIKTSAALATNMARLGLSQEKIASVGLLEGNLARLGFRKMGEDANNPASVSSGTQTPPEASASEEGVPAKPAPAESQAKLVGSNQGAIDYTKRDAKAEPIKDVNKVLTEPALSAKTDKTLATVLTHTNEAGAKISSVRDAAIKTAASRALLSTLLEKHAGEKKLRAGAKEKDSMGGATPPPTPQMPQVL